MKKAFLILLFISINLLAQSQADWNPEQVQITIDISSDSNTVDVDLYSLFGVKDGQELKLFGVMTDTAMTSTALTFKIYDSNQSRYKTFEDEDGIAYTLVIEADKYYPLIPQYFGGINKLQLEFGTAETADREITLIGRVY